MLCRQAMKKEIDYGKIDTTHVIDKAKKGNLEAIKKHKEELSN